MDRVTELYAQTVERGEIRQVVRTVIAFIVLFTGLAATVALIPLLIYHLMSIGFV